MFSMSIEKTQYMRIYNKEGVTYVAPLLSVYIIPQIKTAFTALYYESSTDKLGENKWQRG